MKKQRHFIAAFLLLILSVGPSECFSGRSRQQIVVEHEHGRDRTSASPSSDTDRRSFVGGSFGAAILFGGFVSPAEAGIDPNALKVLPIEGDSGASRLRQVEALKNNPVDMRDVPFEELPSGVSYREFREGKGEAIVQPGSKVGVSLTIRCKSFATANEPGGIKYFSTKVDTDFDELAFTIGSGEMVPGLEEGMLGMQKGAIRRIEVPSKMIFAARDAGQLPLPSDKNKDGKRAFDRLFKTDATLLFEVLVTSIK